MELTERDRAKLAGEAGRGQAIAMEMVVAAGKAMGATSLLDISRAHIDGCIYYGQVSLDFARELSSTGAKVSVPTTLNVSSLDLLHPDLYQGDARVAAAGRELMDCYVAMGCSPTWTCAPYQLVDRPSFGEQIAWGESNAIVFANSVLGARTNRYGDFLDICCALVGRAPAVGLHTDEGRRASIRVDVDVPDSWRSQELLYVALGHLLGQMVGNEVAVITGLDERANEDRLKSLGAAAASSGSVGLFHVAGVTPEAPTVLDAGGGVEPGRVMTVGPEALSEAVAGLSSAGSQLGGVSLGTPHASLRELATLASLVDGRRSTVPFYVNTGRDILAKAEDAGYLRLLEEFGTTIVTDTCTYVTQIMGQPEGVVMTNSGKWAYYAPGNLGYEVVLADTADCVESAVSGTVVTRGFDG